MSTDSPTIKPLQLDHFNDIREAIEEQRHAEFQKVLNWFIAGFIVAIMILIWEVFSNTYMSLGSFLFILFFCLFVPCIFTWQINQDYSKFFTSILVPELIKRFNMQKDVELQYSLLSGISESTFNDCGLFQEPTDYSSEGLISGKIGKTNFECARVLAQEVRENAYGNNRKQTVTLFRGLFFDGDANKNFKGSTFVVPDNLESVFGRTGHSLQELFARHRFGHCELVSLEDPNFERNFAVYSSDQIEARYLLTPLLMQQISAIQNNWNCPIHIAFIYGRIFVAIETPMFQSTSVFTAVSAEVIQSMHQKVLMMLSLVDELGLNTRIWGRS